MKHLSSKSAFAACAALAASTVLFTATLAVGQLREGAEIEAVQEQYRQAWQRGDLDGVMQFWTADAKIFGPGSMAAGAKAIRVSLEQSMSMGINDLRNEDREVYGSGDTIVEVTRSVLFDKAGKAVLTMRYMTLWQKSKGQWRIHREFVIPLDPAGSR